MVQQPSCPTLIRRAIVSAAWLLAAALAAGGTLQDETAGRLERAFKALEQDLVGSYLRTTTTVITKLDSSGREEWVVVERVSRAAGARAIGAWGTQLMARGLRPGECPEVLNLTRPELLVEILNR